MKPLLKIVDTHQYDTFSIMKVNEPYFFPSWHFHPECEIMLVLKGTGMRFVGDHMERFQAGDLVFYGPDIPHFYRSDDVYYLEDSDLVSQAIVVYFKENFLGESFWDLPNISPIKKLFSYARRGIKFNETVTSGLMQRILKLDDQMNGVEKIIDLLTILKIMADTKEFNLLSSNAFTKRINQDECERINMVYQFIMDNYTANPTLEQVAQIAHMSVTAFCRYFKSHTYKTYIQFLNEIKIGNACKLLIDNKLSISQICFETGFNNFSHFNDQFKKIMGLTPREYQKKHFAPTLEFQ